MIADIAILARLFPEERIKKKRSDDFKGGRVDFATQNTPAALALRPRRFHAGFGALFSPRTVARGGSIPGNQSGSKTVSY
jgi:hypothetical protein